MITTKTNKVELTINAETMKEIKRMIKGKKKNKFLPVLDNLKFNVKDKLLTVTTSDYDYIIEKQFKVDATGKGDFLVPLDVIKKITGIKKDSIYNFNLTDNDYLEMNNNGSIKTLRIDDIDNYPSNERQSFEHVSSIGYDDILKLDSSLLSVSCMETRPILQGVLIRDNRIITTDSHRLYMTDTGIKHDTDIVLHYLGAKKLKDTFNKNEGIDVLISNKGNVKFQSESNSIIINQIEGNFPEVDRLIPDHDNTSFTIDNKKQFTDIIKDAASIAKEDRNNVIKFEISDNVLNITAKNPELGNFEGSINIDNFKGDEFKISMSSAFLLDGLKQLTSNELQFKFIGNMRPFTITPIDNNINEMSLILPVRTY